MAISYNSFNIIKESIAIYIIKEYIDIYLDHCNGVTLQDIYYIILLNFCLIFLRCYLLIYNACITRSITYNNTLFCVAIK